MKLTFLSKKINQNIQLVMSIILLFILLFAFYAFIFKPCFFEKTPCEICTEELSRLGEFLSGTLGVLILFYVIRSFRLSYNQRFDSIFSELILPKFKEHNEISESADKYTILYNLISSSSNHNNLSGTMQGTDSPPVYPKDIEEVLIGNEINKIGFQKRILTAEKNEIEYQMVNRGGSSDRDYKIFNDKIKNKDKEKLKNYYEQKIIPSLHLLKKYQVEEALYIPLITCEWSNNYMRIFFFHLVKTFDSNNEIIAYLDETGFFKNFDSTEYNYENNMRKIFFPITFTKS